MNKINNLIFKKIKSQRISFLYHAMINSVLANLFVTIVLTFFLFNKVSKLNLFIWALILFFILTFRLITYLKFIKSKNKSSLSFFILFFIPMAATALMWGLSGQLFFSNNYNINMIVLICILGISMGSVTTLSTESLMTYTFQSLLLLPVVITLFNSGKSNNITIAILVSIFYVLIITISNKVKKIFLENINFKENHRKHIEDLKFSENKFKTIFNHAPVGIFYIDSKYIIYDCNEEFATILETPKHALLNLNISKIDDKRVLKAIGEAIQGKIGNYEGQYITTISKAKVWITLNCSPIFDEDRNIIGVVGIVQDRTEMQLAEEKVRHLAYHDNLTSLPNRLLLKDRLKQATVQAKRNKLFGAILFLDLDNFKNINDTLGHYVGDLILKETADRLKTLLRTGDTVSRIGGDEFVIVLPNINLSLDTSIVSVNLVSDKIHKAIKTPYYYLEKTLFTSTSIGVHLFNNDDDKIDRLLKNADTAMYEAKKNGRGCTHYYNEQMNKEISKRVELETNLRLALQRDEFVIYFQPIYSGIENKLIGAEALIRWIHPTMGIIPPLDFIPLAEETRAIIPIGEWVIGEVCKTINIWKNKYNKNIPYISINISVNQLQKEEFVEIMLYYTKKYNVAPSTILLEVTESQLISNFEFITSKISKLRSYGFKFALDDFGTGYSSLTYLKKLDVDVLKIDRAFIKDINNSNNDVVLVEAILSLAHNFNMKVVAEGVEDIKQLELLKSMGCKYFQGYYYSKPLPANDFKILLN